VGTLQALLRLTIPLPLCSACCVRRGPANDPERPWALRPLLLSANAAASFTSVTPACVPTAGATAVPAARARVGDTRLA
jgi:hypothetical protein